MDFTDSFRQALIDEVVGVLSRYLDSYTTFEADGPPRVKLKTQMLGPWLWVKSRADYGGAKHGYTTDRLSGDPYSAHVFRDWVGKAESAPKSVSNIEELNRWALIHTEYERQYTDVGVWGVHTGRWIHGVTRDGIVTLRVESGRRFQDVSPSAETTPDQIDLNRFNDLSFDGLIQLLDDENSIIRELAIKQLGELGDPMAVDPYLIQAADDDAKYVRERAIDALGKLGGDKAIEKLISILIEREYQRTGPMRALVEIGQPVLDFLSPLIDSKDEKVSIAAIQIIEAIGGDRSYEILFQVIEDRRPSVRACVIDALGVIGNIEVIDTLIEKIEDKESGVQLSAIRALGQLHDKRAVEPLVTVLLSKDRNVRRDAARALSELGWKPSNPGETAWFLFATQEWKKLVALGKSATEIIIRVLEDEEESIRSGILEPLRKSKGSFTDPRAIDPILRIISSDETGDYRRREAILILGKIRLPQVVRPLIQIYLTEEREYFTKAAFKAISELVSSGVAVADTLIQVLTEKRAVKSAYEDLAALLKLFTVVSVTREQIKTITPLLKSIVKRKIDEETTKMASNLLELDDLFTKLTDEHCVTREKAVVSLGEIGLPSVTIPLIEALDDEYPVVRMNAANALGKLGEGALSLILSALRSKKHIVRCSAAIALGRLRNLKAAKHLLKVLSDKHRIVRQNATWALKYMKFGWERYNKFRGTIIKALTKLMEEDEYIPVRFNAVYTMSVLVDPRVIEPLLNALSNPIAEIRLNATYGFQLLSGQLMDADSAIFDRVIDALILAMSDDVDRVRYNAVDALRLNGGEKALEALTAALSDKDKYMRELAERGVKEIKSVMAEGRSSWPYGSRYRYDLLDPEDMDVLIQALGDDDVSIQMSAQVALGNLKQMAFDRLMEVLQDKEEYWLIREGAAGALGRTRDKRAVEVLIEALQDEKQEIRCNAAWSLAVLVDKRSLKALIKATSDESWMVRLNAGAAVGKMGGSAAFEALLKLLKDEHPRVREVATSYLGQFKSSRVLPALRKQLEDDDAEVRRFAKEWLDYLATKKKKKKIKSK